MIDHWTLMFWIEAEVWKLQAALNVVYGYSLPEDEKATIRNLIHRNSDCTPTRIFQAIEMSVPRNAQPEEISNALATVAIVFDRERFKTAFWWSAIEAIERFNALSPDALSSSVN